MAFDFYLYRSRTGKPNVNEAIAVTMEEADAGRREATPEEKERQNAIAKALLWVNPRLERFELDHTAIAELEGISVAEARVRFDYLQLKTPVGDTPLSIDICRNHVALTMPRWQQGDNTEEVTRIANDYAKAIHQTAGYFAFDPQSGRVYNPSAEVVNTPAKEEVAPDLMEREDEATETFAQKKPWWKIW